MCGCVNPQSNFMSELLPHPDGPTIAVSLHPPMSMPSTLRTMLLSSSVLAWPLCLDMMKAHSIDGKMRLVGSLETDIELVARIFGLMYLKNANAASSPAKSMEATTTSTISIHLPKRGSNGCSSCSTSSSGFHWADGHRAS